MSKQGQKHFVFIMVIKALEQHFNLPFQHHLARGHKMKQGEGKKGKRKKAGIDIWSLFRHCRHKYGFWEVTFKSPERPSKNGSETSYQHYNEQTQGHSQQCLGNSPVGWLSWCSEAYWQNNKNNPNLIPGFSYCVILENRSCLSLSGLSLLKWGRG